MISSRQGPYIGYRNQKEMIAATAGAPAGGPPPGGEGPPPPGSDAARLGDAIKRQVGEFGYDKGAADEHVPDRLRDPAALEDWERTYNASVSQEDLRKALGPLDAYLTGVGDDSDQPAS